MQVGASGGHKDDDQKWKWVGDIERLDMISSNTQHRRDRLPTGIILDDMQYSVDAWAREEINSKNREYFTIPQKENGQKSTKTAPTGGVNADYAGSTIVLGKSTITYHSGLA